MTVTEAIKRRISTRQFRPDPVSRELVEEILEVARWAPSGGNLQPWRVIVLAGAERQEIIRMAKQNFESAPTNGEGDRPIYPQNLWEPYRTRRFKVGEDMYARLGIAREDRAARLERWAKNYEFFGAPVGLFFAIDSRLGHAQWAHLGILLQSIALLATERGLATCLQESWSNFRSQLHRHLGLPQHEMVYCGMSLGYPDAEAPVNQLRTERAPLQEIASFRGFAT